MKFSVCIDCVFGGKDFISGMKAVKAAGISAYEFWGWWNKDIGSIERAADESGMETAALCTKFSSLVDASEHKTYIEGLKETVPIAKKLHCRTIITQVGKDLGIPRKEQFDSLVAGLKKCAPIMEAEGLVLAFEPLNTLVDHKGYFLWSADEAFEIEQSVGSDNIKVLYDIYHQQIMDGNLTARITGNINKIAHFHAAGVPGRHELWMGELNYTEIFKAIHGTGYNGYIGLEYIPTSDAAAGLIKTASEMFSLF